MDVTNEVMPTTQERMEQMTEAGPEGPIFMINLLKFKDHAQYEDGRETNLTGREAYNLYAQEVVSFLTDYDGQVVFAGDVTFLALGQVEDLWDEVAIVSYPSRAELLAMSMSKQWQDASVHRAAGLAGQLNIETVAPQGPLG